MARHPRLEELREGLGAIMRSPQNDGILKAIDRKRYAVYPTAEVAALAGVGPLIAPVLRRWFDRQVRRA